MRGRFGNAQPTQFHRGASLTTTSSQLIKRLIIGVVGVNLLIVGLVAVAVERNRARDSELAAVTLRNLSQILEQDIAGFLGKIDLTLLSLRDEVAREIRDGGIDRPWLQAVLADNGTRLPEIHGLRVADAEGLTQFATGEAIAANISIADRPYFAALRDPPRAGLVISSPVSGRDANTDRWTIVLGRRINNQDGTFAGSVHATIGIDHFVKKFETIDVGPKGLVAMRNGDTALVARYPEPENFGSTIGNTAVSEAFRELVRTGRSTGLYTAVSAVDGIERLFLSRKIPGYPLYLTIGLAPDDYLADWKHDSALFGILAAIIILSISLSAWLTIRLWRRQMAKDRAAAYRDALYTAELLQSREEAELARQRSELILSSAGEGVCGVDLEGRITFINETGRNILGLCGENGTGSSLHALAHHRHANGTEHAAEDCPLFQTLHDGVSRHVESDVYWRQDGTSIPVEFTAAPIYQNGVLTGAVNVFRDISHRLRAEEMIARNLAVTATMESVLRQSLENAPLKTILDHALAELLELPWLHLEDRGCIFLLDQERGNLRMIAQRNLSLQILGACATVGVGKCLCGQVAVSGDGIFTNCVDHRHETIYPDMPEHGHYCVPIKSGGTILGVLNTYVRPGHHFDEGEERFLLMFSDTLAGIIERKKIEENLRNSDEISHTLMNATSDAAFLLNSNGIILASNEALAARFGADPGNMIGKNFFDLLPHDVAASRRAQFVEVLRTGTPLHTHDERDGRVFDNRIYPIHDAYGLVAQVAVFSRDVTDRRQAQLEIEKALADLARSNEELQQFAYVASHDMREPLRMVRSYLSILKRSLGSSLTDECENYIAFAIDGARRMELLIHDLLEYSRIGHGEPILAPLKLNEIVEVAIANLGAAIEERYATIHCQDGLPMVLGNPGELIRLFQNLIGNAIKYRAADRDPVVSLEWRDNGAEWLISVRDNGIGIAPEHFDRIFMVFQRLHGRGTYEGTGIGLAASKKIVERHRGRILVESTPGKGSCFSFTLPKMI